jgi:hypothetical protein
MIGMFLATRISQDKANLYQNVYRSETEKNKYINCLFRPTDRMREVNHKTLGKFSTRLPGELIKHLLDEKYPWEAEWGNDFKFKEMTLDMISENETEIEGEDDDDFGLPF